MRASKFLTRFSLVAALIMLAACGKSIDELANRKQVLDNNDDNNRPVLETGVCGNYYDLAEYVRYFQNWWQAVLPNFSSLVPTGRVVLNEFDVQERDWLRGFPGVTQKKEWFGIDFRGKIRVPKTGVYRFTIISDDGSQLNISGHNIINNDGIHYTHSKSAVVHLRAGVYSFSVPYFQGPRFHITLQLFWQKPIDVAVAAPVQPIEFGLVHAVQPISVVAPVPALPIDAIAIPAAVDASTVTYKVVQAQPHVVAAGYQSIKALDPVRGLIGYVVAPIQPVEPTPVPPVVTPILYEAQKTIVPASVLSGYGYTDSLCRQ